MPLVEPQNLTLSFSSESSIQDELERESSADVLTILVSIYFSTTEAFLVPAALILFILTYGLTFLDQVSYLVMFAYISFAVGDSPQWPSFLVTSKVFLPLSSCLC